MERLNVASTYGEDTNSSKEETFEQDTKKYFVGQTKDGASIYEYGESHFHDESGLDYAVLEKAIGAIDTEGKEIVKEQVNFDGPLGLNMCVEVDKNDEIVMVFRKGRMGETPMVKNRSPKECNSVIVIAQKEKDSDDDYQLLTAYIGELAEKEPWDPTIRDKNEKKKCEDFWSSHALIYNADLIDWDRTRV